MLGDSGFHKPSGFIRTIAEPLEKSGIDLTYTENLSDLNADNLKGFAGLMIFANIERITPEADKALFLKLAAMHRGQSAIQTANLTHGFEKVAKAASSTPLGVMMFGLGATSTFSMSLWAKESNENWLEESRLEDQVLGLKGKPISMNWDERGRLWICENLDYPNELQPYAP